MRVAALLTATVIGLGGCGDASLLGLDADQGIEGIALLGPLCPVETPDDPCPPRPLEDARIDIRRRDSGKVTSIRTDADGRFRVGLVPGEYTLVPEEGDPFPSAGELDVSVPAGTWVEVTVSFDTGIR